MGTVAAIRRLAAAAVAATGLVMPPAHAVTDSFAVYARENSVAYSSHDATPLDTGIDFAAGDALVITATGLWNGGACGDVDANGTGCFGIDGTTGINFFSLIGKIGSDSAFDAQWFKVGTSFVGTAGSSGRLFLAFLDSDSSNNSGFVTALVTHAAPVPEPTRYGLMLAGLAAMTLARRRVSGLRRG